MVAQATIPKKTNADNPGERIPLLAKRKARNLYLFEDATHERIAQECGLTVWSAKKLVSREGWVAERRARASLLVQKQDARMSRIDDEIIDAIASTSEQHALQALQKVGQTLERTDKDAAKDFQAYTAGVKNLASTARLLREPAGSAAVQSAPTNFNLFFVAPSVNKAADKVAEATVVKQVNT